MEINGLREGMPSEREGAGVENEKASIRSCAGSRPWALLYRLLKRPSGRMAEDFLNRSRLIEPVRNQTFAFGKNPVCVRIFRSSSRSASFSGISGGRGSPP